VFHSLFVWAHPDDDTLGGGAAIAAEKASGKKVFVIMVTDGEATGVRDLLNGSGTSSWAGYTHNPTAEDYAPLTQDDIKAARRREFETAMRTLQVDEFIYLSLPDGGVDTTSVQTAVENYAQTIVNQYGGQIDLKGHTYKTVAEDHPDHLAIGNALHNIAVDAPTWLRSSRYFILWELHGSSFIGLTVARVNAIGADAARVVMAGRAYEAWAPVQGMFAVGGHSVPEAFTALFSDPHGLYHS